MFFQLINMLHHVPINITNMLDFSVDIFHMKKLTRNSLKT